MQQLQPVFDAWPAVGNLGEIVLAERLLIFKTKRAVIGGDNLQMVFAQSLPKLRLVALLAQRWREDVFGALPSLVLHVVFNREEQVLRARLGKSREAPV